MSMVLPKRMVRAIAAVELAIVLPLLLLVLIGVIQYGAVFYLKNQMISAAREGARVVAIQSGTPSQGITRARNYLSGWTLSFTVTATETPVAAVPGETEVTVEVRTPVAQAAPMLNAFGGLVPGGDLVARASMRKE